MWAQFTKANKFTKASKLGPKMNSTDLNAHFIV